jgi:hypothetical protein
MIGGRVGIIGTGAVDQDALQTEEVHVTNMLNFSVVSTNDEKFHFKLYQFLLDHDKKSYLLDLDTIHVENFLRKNEDQNDYYE